MDKTIKRWIAEIGKVRAEIDFPMGKHALARDIVVYTLQAAVSQLHLIARAEKDSHGRD